MNLHDKFTAAEIVRDFAAYCCRGDEDLARNGLMRIAAAADWARVVEGARDTFDKGTGRRDAFEPLLEFEALAAAAGKLEDEIERSEKRWRDYIEKRIGLDELMRAGAPPSYLAMLAGGEDWLLDFTERLRRFRKTMLRARHGAQVREPFTGEERRIPSPDGDRLRKTYGLPKEADARHGVNSARIAGLWKTVFDVVSDDRRNPDMPKFSVQGPLMRFLIRFHALASLPAPQAQTVRNELERWKADKT